VIVLGKVYDLSPLLAEDHGLLVDPLVEAAGTDISHWFDRATGDVKTHVDPVSNVTTPYTPMGRFVHVPSMLPSSAESTEGTQAPWWKGSTYVVGTLTARARNIRIVNLLSSHEHIVEVCAENTIEDMQRRYLDFNAHCGSYTWKALMAGEFRPLDVHKTLQENGVADDGGQLDTLGLDEDSPEMLTTLVLAFNDDLTIA
jgi:hypothetical protein